MSIDEGVAKVLPILKEWERLQNAVDDSYASYQALTECAPESPMWQPVFAISEAYSAVISAMVGDSYAWLAWYHWDNDMGKRKHTVSYPKDEEVVEVDSVEKLAYVICRGNGS